MDSQFNRKENEIRKGKKGEIGDNWKKRNRIDSNFRLESIFNSKGQKIIFLFNWMQLDLYCMSPLKF